MLLFRLLNIGCSIGASLNSSGRVLSPAQESAGAWVAAAQENPAATTYSARCSSSAHTPGDHQRSSLWPLRHQADRDTVLTGAV